MCCGWIFVGFQDSRFPGSQISKSLQIHASAQYCTGMTNWPNSIQCLGSDDITSLGIKSFASEGVHDKVRDKVHDKVRDKVHDKVDNKVPDKVHDNDRYQDLGTKIFWGTGPG